MTYGGARCSLEYSGIRPWFVWSCCFRSGVSDNSHACRTRDLGRTAETAVPTDVGRCNVTRGENYVVSGGMQRRFTWHRAPKWRKRDACGRWGTGATVRCAILVLAMIYLNSSAIRAVSYDPWSMILTVLFTSGPTLYDYYSVPAEKFQGLLAASSHGTYFGAYIRKQYSCRPGK